jgi:Rrf2 family protein
MKSFLKAPQRVHHGLLLVTALARSYGTGAAVTLDSVAADGGVSQGYLEQVAGCLRKAGLVKGRRGKGGGYVLAVRPDRVTVGGVIAAIEGPLAIAPCVGAATSACPRSGHCASENVWRRVQGEIAATLNSLTITKAAGLRMTSKKNIR